MTFEIDIDFSDIEKTAAALDALDDVVRAEINDTMEASLSMIDQAIRPRVPVGATGILRQSAGREIATMPGGEMQGRYLFEAPYAYDVEVGRPPGEMPNPEDIAYWALRKPALLPGESPTSAGWRIARAIEKNGTRAANYVRDGYAAVETSLRDYWAKIADRIAKRIEDKLQ